ncbi:hypothetical protein HY251_19540, partial [bacterium]|nr:hypothetical protein [bacterium]
EEAWSDLEKRAAADARWKELGLPWNERTALRFFGQDVGLAVLVPKGGGSPALVLMTKLDLVGLAGDLAQQGGLGAVWKKISAFLGAGGTGERYLGYDISTRREGKREYFFALVGDALLASTERNALRECLDAWARNAPSLAGVPSFEAETLKLPRETAARAWLDMKQLRNRRDAERTVRSLAEFADAEDAAVLRAFDGEVLRVLEEDLQPREGLAFAFVVPHGDVYATRVVCSRDVRSVFRDAESHPTMGAMPAAPLAFLETRGIGKLLAGFPGSSTWRTLAATEAAKECRRAFIEDALSSKPVSKHDPSFELGIFLPLLARVLGVEVLGEDVIAAVTLDEKASEPAQMFRGIAILRDGPLVRIATDVLSGLALTESAKARPLRGPHFEVVESLGKKVYGFADEGAGVYWVRHGAELILATQPAEIECALGRAERLQANAKRPYEQETKRLGDSHQLSFTLNVRQYAAALRKLTANRKPDRPRERPDPLPIEIDSLERSFETISAAIKVSEDYSAARVRTFQAYGPKTDADHKGLTVDRETTALGVLPQEAFVSFSLSFEPGAAWRLGLSQLRAILGKDEVEKGLRELREHIAWRDPEQALVSNLTGCVGFALALQDRLPLKDAKQAEIDRTLAVPAVILCAQLKDEPAFRAAFLELVTNYARKTSERQRREQNDMEARTGERPRPEPPCPLELLEESRPATRRGSRAPIERRSRSSGTGTAPTSRSTRESSRRRATRRLRRRPPWSGRSSNRSTSWERRRAGRSRRWRASWPKGSGVSTSTRRRRSLPRRSKGPPSFVTLLP